MVGKCCLSARMRMKINMEQAAKNKTVSCKMLLLHVAVNIAAPSQDSFSLFRISKVTHMFIMVVFACAVRPQKVYLLRLCLCFKNWKNF